MSELKEIVLIAGIIFLAAYSVKVSQESQQLVHKMNQSIQMMFVKS